MFSKSERADNHEFLPHVLSALRLCVRLSNNEYIEFFCIDYGFMFAFRAE